MKVTICVPLAGQGVIARYGALVGVTADRGPEPDPLLRALAEAAAAAGDGGDLVSRAARAAFRYPGQPAWACAGVTADGGVAVFVHGGAVATVSVDGGPPVTLATVAAVNPMSRKFTGTTVALGLTAGEAAPPDPQYWLGDGVVRGGGLAVTMTGDPVGWHPPTAEVPAPAGIPVTTPTVNGSRADQSPAETFVEGIPGVDDPPAVLVDGVLCARGHFNDPASRACRSCDLGLAQPPRDIRRGPRPPLGVLVLDDGSTFPLDRDCVLGREPAFDSDVIAGRSRPLRISDQNGTVSRLHLRISLVGWQVEATDLGSANGSVLHSSDGERSLIPYEPTIIEPGARIGIGHRSMQYLAYQGVRP